MHTLALLRRARWIRIAFAATLSASNPTGAQAPERSGDFVLVRRVIDARYFALGPEQPISKLPKTYANAPIDWASTELRSALPLQAALRSQITREVSVPKGDSMQALVLREYGFGKRDSAAAYSALESKIVDSNGLAGPEGLLKGTTVKIPALPPMAPTAPSSFNLRNLLPKTSVYPALAGVAAGRTFDAETLTYREKPKFNSSFRKGSPLVAQYLWLPRERVERERTLLGTDSVALEVHAEIVTARLDTSDADEVAVPGSLAASGAFPSLGEQATLANQLAHEPLQAPVLIVLDDGWPNDTAYQNAAKWLASAFKAIENKFRYPAGPNVRALAGTRGTTYPKEKFHARSIEQSLSALVAMEPLTDWDQKRVRVVYLPMTPAQANAAGVLEDLIALRLMDDLVGRVRGDDAPLPSVVADIRKAAKEIVARIPKDIGVVDVTTDKAVIESVLWFADLYARATDTPYVANFSWTTPKLLNRYADLRFHYGLLVSAAGNESSANCSACRPHLASTPACSCADNVAAQQRWFAVRAVDGEDVVAVMNAARDGSLQCKSSIVGSMAKVPMAVALDGNVGPDVCGTSFAAPRVAWLAAARLAYFDPKNYFPNEVDRGQQLLDLIKDARIGGVGRDDQFNLDVQKLFKP